MPLRLLYVPQEEAREVAQVDIIAVHGLNPRSVPDADHAWDTWRKPSGDKGRLWLRDDLPKYAPYARIFLYQYNSKLVYGGDKARFIDKANDLLEALRIERKKEGKRPLIFLAHSLGGILVRQALVNAHSNPNYTIIHTSTTGLAFFGTPHEGGDEKLVALGAAAARIASALHVQPSNDLIETLKKGSLFSDLLAEQWRHHLESYQLISFWEGIGDIVPKKSATFGLSGNRENVVRLEATHSDLCRFNEYDEDNSKLVLSNIEDLYERAISTSYSFNEHEALGWVSRIPYQQHHNTNKSEILKGTGLWLFEEEIFTKWKQDDRSTILWLHGIPGCGKTKLTSLVVEEQRAAMDQRQGLAFFYCNRNDAERERANPEGILRSIVRQLSRPGPNARVSEFVATKYTERERNHFADGPLRLDECVDLIVKLTNQYTSTTIIIDALDECDVTMRHSLLAGLSNIMQHGLSTKIFVSSRDDKDITLQLQNLPNLYIKATNNSKDIDRYVHFKVEQAVADRRLLDGNVSARTVQYISDTLTGKAQGMFLWVTLQLQNLCSLGLNVEEDLFGELGRLPGDLADTYAQIFEHFQRLGPESRVIAERSLKWLLCQAREFSEAEFLASVSIDTEPRSLNLTKETIVFICGNLVMFDHELKVFRFVHLSVREYLETQPNFTLGAAHALGAEISLSICLHRYTDLAAKYARKFRRYAFLYWLHHCQETKKSGLGGPLHQSLEEFLHIREGTNLYYATWARSVYRLGSESDNWSVESNDDSNDGTDDHLIKGILKELRPSFDGALKSGSRLAARDLEEYEILDSILGDRNYPYDPTLAACYLDLPEIVDQNLRSVLSSPAKEVEDLASDNINVYERRNVKQQTYLHVACHSGSSKLLRLLLQYPFSVCSTDEWGRTALHYAVDSHGLASLESAKRTGAARDAHDQAMAAERVAMIGLLIAKGSIIDAVDDSGRTALQRASSANRCTEAQFLLEHGAFVDAPSPGRSKTQVLEVKKGNIAMLWFPTTPLLLAVESGHTDLARLLLQFKADIEARDRFGTTPLLLAVESGHTDLARLLLQNKADIEARDLYKRTPLLLAVHSGRTAVARLLLQFKADTEARDSDQKTPLLQAIKSGDTAIAQLLLQSRADIEARDQYGRTPLLQAAMKGNTDTGRLLLRHGADINAKNSDNRTPLAESLLLGHEAVAQMLIDESASIQGLDLSGNTALHYAAASRLGATISRLLEMGAYTNETYADGSTPLHRAIKPKDSFSKPMDRTDEAFHPVQLLIDAGANVEMSDNGGRTPLHLAAQEADKASVQILLNRGANTEARDKMGRLPLDHAAKSGSLQVFSLLFKRWADVMAESSEFTIQAWLHLADKKARGDGVEILQNWRTMSFEDLIELTSDCEIQRNWSEKGPRGFSSWYRARQLVRKMRAQHQLQPVI